MLESKALLEIPVCTEKREEPNFFSILKTECIYRAKPRTYEEARLLIDEYIYFYNYQRIQLKTKLTPMEYRRQFVAWKVNIVS